MTPSNPAVGVPMKRSLREPDVTSEPRRTALDRRESNAHIPPLHPELLLLILAVIHRKKDAGPARTAACDPRIAETGVPAVRAPIFHEFIEWIIAARRRVRAAEQGVRSLVIPCAQKTQELLHLPLFAEIVEIEIERSADYHQRNQRNHQNLDDFSAPFFTGAVLLQIPGHLFDYGSLLGRWSSCRGRRIGLV